MKKESYMSLLILCAVFSQGIVFSSNENIEESSSLHSRKKRVIDRTNIMHQTIPITMARYIVNILKNGMSHCAGAILDFDMIITVPECVVERPRLTYTILSASEWRHNGSVHYIVERSLHLAFDFVVCKIAPPINIRNGINRKIDLFLGEIDADSYAVFSGWGCFSLGAYSGDVRYPQKLLRTRLPLITNDQCSAFAAEEITNEYVCTLDSSKRRGTCNGDEGGPLVYEGRLLGILFKIGTPAEVHPDIFFNFNHPDVHHWINLNINILRALR